MSIEDEFTTLKKLDDCINSKKYRTFNYNNNRDEQLVSSGKTNYGPYSNGIELECMLTSGNNLDCLIHSFLMSTCPAFRRRIRLDRDGRVTDRCGAKQFATDFRTIILPHIIDAAFTSLPAELGNDINSLKEQAIGGIAAPGDLEDTHLRLLSIYYQCNILLFGLRGRGSTLIKPKIFPYGGDGEVYIISNRGGHFESVRVFRTNQYTTPIMNAIEIVNESENKESTTVVAEYATGQGINIKGINYYVYGYVYSGKNIINSKRRVQWYKVSRNKDLVDRYLRLLEQNRMASMDMAVPVSEKDKREWLNINEGQLDDKLDGNTISANDIESAQFKRINPINVANAAIPLGMAAAPLGMGDPFNEYTPLKGVAPLGTGNPLGEYTPLKGTAPLGMASAERLSTTTTNANAKRTREVQSTLTRNNNAGSTAGFGENSSPIDYTKLAQYDTNVLEEELATLRAFLEELEPQAGGRKTRRKRKTRRA